MLAIGMCHSNKDIVNADILSNRSYGPDERNKMDVFLPLRRDSSTAMIMLVHGGAWIVGNKSSWPADIINGLLKQGFAVSCINYRYASGDFHRQMEDMQMASRYVHVKSREWKTARDKLGMVGVSAGGHLALLYAHAYDSAGYVKAVVSLAGPTDLSDPLLHQFLQHYGIGFAVKKFLGGSQQDKPKVYIDASPIYHLSHVPCLFMNGQKDDLVPAVQAFRMHDSLAVHGIPTDTIYFANAGHYIFGPKNVNDGQITDRISRWMHTYMR